MVTGRLQKNYNTARYVIALHDMFVETVLGDNLSAT